MRRRRRRHDGKFARKPRQCPCCGRPQNCWRCKSQYCSLSRSGRVETLAFRRRLQHARRVLSLGDGGLPTRRAYGFRDPSASGLDNEISTTGTEWRRGQRVRDLIRDICGQHEVQIMKGHVAKDHVHLFVSIPPQVTISRLLQWLKGKTAHHLLVEYPHLKKQF